MEEKTISETVKFQEIIDTIGTLQTAWGLVAACLVAILFIICVIAFRRNVNKATEAQIGKFIKEGKYLPSVYVELHRTMESLRYFAFSHKWKHRIIKQYNHLFKGYEGTRLKKIFGQKAIFKLSIFSSLSKLNNALGLMHVCLEDLKKNETEYYHQFGQIIWAIRNSTYNYTYIIEQLQELSAMISRKNIVLIGSAGNGKTSLLCRMSEILIANKIPCMLINSRDIKEDCADYIIKKLPLAKVLQGKAGIYLRLVSILLFIQRKHLYILIDAINENDREVFVDSIGKLMEVFSKYNRIRILFTCRSEYFDSRYKILFSDGSEDPYIFSLTEAHYDERATKKMIMAYMEHYKVNGPFSVDMHEKLMNSLFLTRIFFEVNSNRNECKLEFRNAEIYKLYFEKVAKEHSELNLKEIVNKIAELMFEYFSFDRIPMASMQLSSEDSNLFRRLLDNNLIISHTIHSGKGITESEEEYVYFVFDEFRDFCLARYLLMVDEHNRDNGYSTFFTQAGLLFSRRLSPTEGVVKYAYHHFKEIDRDDLCKRVLDTFGETDVQSILDWRNHKFRSQRWFSNFGFTLIFSEGDDISPFEVEYIRRCVEKDCSHYWDVFWYLLGNEYFGFKPNINLAVDILAYWNDYEVPEKILEYFFQDRFDRYSPYRNDKRRVDLLREWVEHIEAENDELSDSLKLLLVILAAYEPMEYALNEYHRFLLDEKLYQNFTKKFSCSGIRLLVDELRKQIKSEPTAPEFLKRLIEMLCLEGENE